LGDNWGNKGEWFLQEKKSLKGGVLPREMCSKGKGWSAKLVIFSLAKDKNSNGTQGE